MEFKHERWYTICNDHKKKVDVDGNWANADVDENGHPIEKCDYIIKGNKPCRKEANWEFYPGETWK